MSSMKKFFLFPLLFLIPFHGAHAITKVIYLTSGSTFVVPVDWNNASNTVEAIGGGGGGAGANQAPGGSGGGGAYSKSVNLTLVAGATVPYQVGAGGKGGAANGSNNGTAGGDTWFGSTTFPSSGQAVGAKGGGLGTAGVALTSAGTSGSGGAAASGYATGTGNVKSSGGNGGNANAFHQGSGGAGGAAGPHGAGANGGATTVSNAGGGGGGGGGGGSAGADDGDTRFGAAGGNNYLSTGGGAGGDGILRNPANGADGTAGGGGGGGGSNNDSNPGNPYGGAGGAGTDWDSVHGAGGGGGGGGEYQGYNGGNGGLYGGGGAGGSYYISGVGGNGAQGIIVITYTPSTRQVFLGKTGGSTSGSATRYYFIHGFSAINQSAENIASTTMPFGGSFQTFYAADNITLTGNQQWTVSLRKNLGATGVGCTITASSPIDGNGNQYCSDIVDGSSFVAGDDYLIQVTPSNSPTADYLSWSLVMNPTNPNDTLLSETGVGNYSQTVEDYLAVNEDTQAVLTTQATSTAMFIPEAGTLSNLYNSMTKKIAAGTVTITAMNGTQLNGDSVVATTTMTCAVTGSANGCSDTSHTQSAAAQSMLYFADMPTGTPTQAIRAESVDFVPNNLGDFIFTANNFGASLTQNSTRFLQIMDGATQSSIEASTTAISNAMIVTGVEVHVATAAAAGQTRTITLRDNGANTAVTCQMTNADNLDKICTGFNVSIGAGDEIDTQIVSSATVGPTSGIAISYIAKAVSASPIRTMRLFEGFKIKLISGRLKLLPIY